jgi:N-acyl amino acid synthase of PEP-CTERM/exosortase system
MSTEPETFEDDGEALDWTPHFTFPGPTDAESIRLLSESFKLRYQAYCLDRKFLRAEDYPDESERDQHDPRSTHFCALNRQGRVVGTVRLVHPSADQPFPFQEHGTAIFPAVKVPPVDACAEVSRLVVDRFYRRRTGDSPEGISIYATLEPLRPPLPGERRSNRPEIVLGLYRAMYRFSRSHGIEYWYAAMERPLARALDRFDFSFQQIGPEMDYFGPVAPYMASLSELESALERSNPLLLAWFRGSSS